MHPQASGSPSPIPAPSRREKLALRILQCGAIAAAIAAAPFPEYELDRFLVPKEWILHGAALSAAGLLLPNFRRSAFTRIDLLLVTFVGLGILSALLATNPWVAMRAVALSGSSVILFQAARVLRELGLAPSLLRALAGAVVLGAATSVAQAYGLETALFSEDRAPGGTLGNRNFVAHLTAFGFPVLLLCALQARHLAGYALGGMIVAGSLLMTRSRAGWLAFGGALFILLLAMLGSRMLRSDRAGLKRLIILGTLGGAGILGVVLLPNDLQWNSDNPYLESAQGLVNFQEGSGRGRILQYGQSLRMAVAEPFLGVGPGNWPVRYPEYALPQDPSLDSTAPGATANPWPSSDWIAFLSERGFPAAVTLALALLGIAFAGVRGVLRAQDRSEAFQSAALVATLVAAGVAGMLDAVLLLALPSYLVWLSLGLLWPSESVRSLALPGRVRSAIILALLVTSGIGMIRSSAQIASMAIYTTQESTEWLRRAAMIDPGNYRLHLRLARSSGGASRPVRCEHALAALGLFPNAEAPRNLSNGCGE